MPFALLGAVVMAGVDKMLLQCSAFCFNDS